MNKKLIIAEKPEVARAIGVALLNTSSKASLPIVSDAYVITSAAGHILRLSEPEEVSSKWSKPWKLEELPIYIEAWPKVPITGKEKYLDIIEKWLPKVDSVIHAGDIDDAGQLIVDEILEYFRYQGKVERVLINNNLAKNIIKAFDDLRDNKDFEHKGKMALARSVADFAFGATWSRHATLMLDRGVSIGRVQTPTLGLVVTRDYEIANHIKENYYELLAFAQNTNFSELPLKLKPHKALLGDSKHVLDREVLETVASSVESTTVTLNTKVTISKKNPPLPYHFDALCIEMSKKYGFSSKETLAITQSLKDNYNAITYNRSNSSYLSSEHYKLAEQTLTKALTNTGLNLTLDFSLKSKAFDDASLEGDGHHGIIPEDISLDFSKLSNEEKQVYVAITKRYAIQFLLPAEYEKSKTFFETEHGTFSYEVKRLISPGYLEIEGDVSDDSDKLWLEEGTQEVAITKCEIEEKESQPKKHYSEATLLADMTSIAKYVKDDRLREALLAKDSESKNEKGSIGTVATRATIIDTLLERGYIERKGKQIRSTELGQTFFNALPDPIKSADLTALWYLMQLKIAEGAGNINMIQKSVVDTFEAIKDTAYKGKTLEETVGICPLCKSAVIDKKVLWECVSNKYKKDTEDNKQIYTRISGCGFKMFKKAFGKALTVRNLEELLEKGVTSRKVAGLKKSKDKGTFSAKLKLDKVSGRISAHF